MLSKELGSIIAFCMKINPVMYYTKRVPYNIRIPSMYFPIPNLSGELNTKDTFKNDYSWYIKIFERTSPEAFKKAKNISDSILSNKSRVPEVNYNGSISGDYIQITSIDIKEIQEGVVQLTIDFKKEV
jgi:hypothetical protein